MQMTSFTVRGAYERTETTGWLLKDVFFFFFFKFTNHPGPPAARAVRGRWTYYCLLFMVPWTNANYNTVGGGGFHHDVGAATPRIINAKRSEREREKGRHWDASTVGSETGVSCGVNGAAYASLCCVKLSKLSVCGRYIVRIKKPRKANRTESNKTGRATGAQNKKRGRGGRERKTRSFEDGEKEKKCATSKRASQTAV